MYNIHIMATSKVMLNIKINTDLKKKAQKLSRDFGLSLSTVINRKLQEFVEEKEISFKKPLKLNKKTEKFLTQVDNEIKNKDMANFSETLSADDFLSDLKK